MRLILFFFGKKTVLYRAPALLSLTVISSPGIGPRRQPKKKKFGEEAKSWRNEEPTKKIIIDGGTGSCRQQARPRVDW